MKYTDKKLLEIASEKFRPTNFNKNDKYFVIIRERLETFSSLDFLGQHVIREMIEQNQDPYYEVDYETEILDNDEVFQLIDGLGIENSVEIRNKKIIYSVIDSTYNNLKFEVLDNDIDKIKEYAENKLENHYIGKISELDKEKGRKRKKELLEKELERKEEEIKKIKEELIVNSNTTRQ